MTRLLVGSLLAAVVMFVWCSVLWMATPVMMNQFKTAKNPDKVRETLMAEMSESGTYVLPWSTECSDGENPTPEEQKFAKQHTDGPLVLMSYRKEGAPVMDWTVFAKGFGHMFGTALLVGFLLTMSLPSLKGYFARVGFVLLAGVFALVAVQPENPIWFHQPWGYPLTKMWTGIVGWGLSALVLAAVVRSRQNVNVAGQSDTTKDTLPQKLAG